MRRKLTEKIEISGHDLPELTDNQRRFVEGILAGKTASDSYRAAYDCSNSVANTVWCEASKLRNHPNVSQWIAAAREAGLGHARVTLDGHISELERLREIALKTGNVGAAVQAEQLRGKAAGHYTEKLDITTHDPLETLKQIADLSPELAKRLADEAGITWTHTEH